MFFHFLGDQGGVSPFSDYVVDPFTLLCHTWYLTNTRCMIEPFHVYRSKIWPWQVLQRFWICAEDYIRESNVYRSDFMGPCDTIINSFFLLYSWTNQRTICRQYTFLLSSRNGATFSHAPTAFVSVCLYILWLSFLLYPACFKFNLILLVSFAEPKLITLLISFVWVSLSGLYWCNECWKVIYPALRDCKCTKYSEYGKAVTFQ